MSFRVLRAEGGDENEWLAVLARFPAEMRDLHYTPAYGRIYADTYGHEPMLAVLETDTAVVMHAFVLRPLGPLPFMALSHAPTAVRDAATPYGFGGPLMAGTTPNAGPELLRHFDECWRCWCREQRIPAEFVCLHPVLGNADALAGSGVVAPVATKEVVIVDLALTEEQLWAAVSRGTRSSIQRARREGVEVEVVEPDRAALDTFQALYLATMARVGAAERWLFPATYFRACMERLGTQGSTLLFARCRGEIAAAYLLIRDSNTAYYHFGASDDRFLALRPNNLLMYETLLWARRQGCSRYHLGGGVTSDGNDSLLRFKSSFGGHRALLYTYGRVLHEGVYRELCDMKLRHEMLHATPVAAPDFFPLYRR